MADLFQDVARFRPDDEAALVGASFACPICLCPPGLVKLSADPQSPSADCSCDGCEILWTLTLSGFQYLRLRVAPPAQLARVELDATISKRPRYRRD